MKLEPLPLPHPTTFFMPLLLRQLNLNSFSCVFFLSVVMSLNFNQFFIFLSALQIAEF